MITLRRFVAASALTAACLPGFVGSAQAGPALDKIKRTGEITIAHREASVPFSYLDETSRPIGYAIDLCHKFVEAVGRALRVRPIAIRYLSVTSTTRIDSVVEGRAEMVCDSTSNVAERRERVAFSVPHYITGAKFAVRADSGISGFGDFQGKSLVSTAGTTPLKAVRLKAIEHGMRIQIREVADHVSGLEAVAKGEADGFVMDEVLLKGLIASRATTSDVRIKVVGAYLTIEALGIMLPRNDPELKRIVDNEIRRLIRSGEAMAIHDRWFMQPIPPYGRALNLAMPYLLKDFWRFPNDWVPN